MQTLQSCHWIPHSFHRIHVHLSEYLLEEKKENFLFIQILMIMAAAPKSLLSMRSVQRLCGERASLERKFLPINPNYPSNSYYKIGTVLLRKKYPPRNIKFHQISKNSDCLHKRHLDNIDIFGRNCSGPPAKPWCPVRGEERNQHFLSPLSHSDAVKKVEGVIVWNLKTAQRPVCQWLRAQPIALSRGQVTFSQWHLVEQT